MYFSSTLGQDTRPLSTLSDPRPKHSVARFVVVKPSKERIWEYFFFLLTVILATPMVIKNETRLDVEGNEETIAGSRNAPA